MRARANAWFLLLVLVIPVWLAATLTSAWSLAFTCQVTWLQDVLMGESAHQWVPSMAYEKMAYPALALEPDALPFSLPAPTPQPADAPAAPSMEQDPPLAEVPLGEAPRSLMEATRLAAYLEFTGDSNPYLLHPHPDSLAELQERQAGFVTMMETAHYPQVLAGIDLCFAGLDFWGYWLVFTAVGLLCVAAWAGMDALQLER